MIRLFRSCEKTCRQVCSEAHDILALCFVKIGDDYYKAAFAHANDPAKFAEELQKAGYATDPKYADKLKTIISTYKLGEYDQ